ncbi:MAG: hypothetical protein HC804_00815 [Anaerolineae bacterium]|nr:hypothetical protein [Anaerolineae bacterium]
MKRSSTLIILLMAALLVACGPSNVTTEPTAPASTNDLPEVDVVPRPTITSTAVSADAYPAAPTPANALPEGYPVPEALATHDPYPGLVKEEDQSWMIIPAGVQCEDPLHYPTEADAVTALEAEGIAVLEAKTMELMVTSSCGSPTSTHYLVLIDAANQANAEAMGWEFAE